MKTKSNKKRKKRKRIKIKQNHQQIFSNTLPLGDEYDFISLCEQDLIQKFHNLKIIN